MKMQIALWSIGLVIFGALLFGLGRLSNGEPTPQGVPAYSLSPGVTGMIGGGGGYVYDSYTGEDVAIDELVGAVQRYLERQNNPDLVLERLREFRWAYLAEVIERSTGRHAFGMMVGKAIGQISPEAGPNLFWNTKYGSMIAEVGGGYGMVGRLLPEDPQDKMPLAEPEARRIAEQALIELDDSLKLNNETAVFYGFYEFYVVQGDETVGELDVNGYNGQVWYKDWGEPQRSVQNLIPGQ